MLRRGRRVEKLRKNELRAHSLWMISGQCVAILFQTVYFIVMGRMLGSREYGAFVGVVSLIAVLSHFSGMGMEMVLLRDVSRDRKAFAPAWGTALRVIAYGFVALLAVAIFVAHFVLRPELRVLVPFIALSDGLLGKIAQLAGRAFQGAGQMSSTAKLAACTNGARALVAAGLFWFAHVHSIRPTAYVWSEIYWLSSLAVAVGGFVLVTKRLGWPRFRKITWREVTEGFSFCLSNSSISVYNDLDKTFLVSMGQIYAAGIYSAAYRVIDMVSTPIYSVYAAATPRIFRDGLQGARSASQLTNKLLKRMLLYGAAAALCLFLAAPVLPLVFGHSFAGSVSVLRWLCILPLLRGLHYSWGTAITGSSSQWYRTATQLSAAVLNIILSFVLIPRWSWQGAAMASLLTDGALAFLSWLVLRRLCIRESIEIGASAV